MWNYAFIESFTCFDYACIRCSALTPFLWGFEEREKLMEFMKECRVLGFILLILDQAELRKITWRVIRWYFFICWAVFYRIDEIKEMLTNNRVWKQRLVNIGVVSKQQALNWGFSGVMLRGSGVPWDLRWSNLMMLIIYLIFLYL